MTFALPLLLTAIGYSAAAQDSLCAAHSPDADPSLYCLPLHPTGNAPRAMGTAVLQPETSPFGLAVTRDGRVRSRLVLTLTGLPEPKSLGPYRSYTAWATTPDLDPPIALGTERDRWIEIGRAHV